MKHLKIGDELYKYQYHHIISKHTVIKVTKRYAYVNVNNIEVKLHIKINKSGYVSEVTITNGTSFYIPSPERLIEWQTLTALIEVRKKLKEINLQAYSLDKLTKILELL